MTDQMTNETETSAEGQGGQINWALIGVTLASVISFYTTSQGGLARVFGSESFDMFSLSYLVAMSGA